MAAPSKIVKGVSQYATLLTESPAALIANPALEAKLPKANIPEALSGLSASMFLLDTLQYARAHGSRGEYLYRQNYLKPLLKHFAEREGTEWGEDEAGNLYAVVGEGARVIHVAHIDTVHDVNFPAYQAIKIDMKTGSVKVAPIKRNSVAKQVEVARYVNDVDVKHSYTTYELPKPMRQSLGSDDAVGVAAMLYMIAHECPGTYLFTRAEEVGCIGIAYAVEHKTLDFSQFDYAIEIDRKGTKEIICNMGVGNTASPEFGTALAAQLGLGHNITGKGTVTDIASLADVIPECVNISAGYDLQHSDRETCDYFYLDLLADAMVDVDWSSLPIARTAGVFHSKPAARKTGLAFYDDDYFDERIANYNQYGNYGYSHQRNIYGDWTVCPSTLSKKLNEMTVHEAASFIRSNVSFVADFLQACNLSPAMMHLFLQGEPEVIDEVAEATGEGLDTADMPVGNL